MNADDPAFPVPPDIIGPSGEISMFRSAGLTKRELMATIICAGICANPDISREVSDEGIKPPEFRRLAAEGAVKQAAELLAVLDSCPPC